MSESEKRVKGIWSEVFGRSDIAVTDNFLKLVEIPSRVCKFYQIKSAALFY